jgi:hypothetical protein
MLATRPLPPRSNPEYSTTGSGTRDIDLVIPRPTIVERFEEQAAKPPHGADVDAHE